MTPLAPSVEKAYYRKCIQLKRRLNEVEAANDEAKVRRLRLDRAIMKMRLERAFLLDELRKRMDQNVDGSDGSGDEGLATPPPDRPHRDKRRRQHPQQSTAHTSAPPANSFQTPSAQRSEPMVTAQGGQMVPGNAMNEDGPYGYDAPQQSGSTLPPAQPPALPHGSPYGPPPTGMPSATNGLHAEGRDNRPISRQAGVTGEPVGSGAAVIEENGERKVASSSAENAHADTQDTDRGAFTAVNN